MIRLLRRNRENGPETESEQPAVTEGAAEQPAEGTSGTVQGHLEAVINGRAVGWAWDSARPDERVEVELIVDGEPAATGVADKWREKLAQQGMGDGNCVFSAQLPKELLSTPFHTIKALAGPEREPLPPAAGFRTNTKTPDNPWSRVQFAPEGTVAARRWATFKAEDEKPPDLGDAALVGQGAWLFPWGDGDTVPDGEPEPLRLSAEQLEAQRQRLTRWHGDLRQLGVPHLFALAPMKERVVAEFPLKESLRRSRAVPQINRAIRDSTCPEVIDLLPALTRSRGDEPLFNRTDSHWNHRGAYFAYRALMKEASKRVLSLQPVGVDAAGFVRFKGHRGDLSGKPKVRLTRKGVVPVEDERAWAETVEEIDPSKLRARRMPPPDYLAVPGSDRAPHLYEIEDAKDLPRAILMGDSWCLALIPWLAEHFQRFIFLWTDEPPLDAIELELPDVLFHVTSERSLLDDQSPGTR